MRIRQPRCCAGLQTSQTHADATSSMPHKVANHANASLCDNSQAKMRAQQRTAAILPGILHHTCYRRLLELCHKVANPANASVCDKLVAAQGCKPNKRIRMLQTRCCTRLQTTQMHPRVTIRGRKKGAQKNCNDSTRTFASRSSSAASRVVAPTCKSRKRIRMRQARCRKRLQTTQMHANATIPG